MKQIALKRTPIATNHRADTRSAALLETPTLKNRPIHADKMVVFDDRLTPYSRARSASWAKERDRLLGFARQAIKPKNIIEHHACELIADMLMQIRKLDRVRLLVLERARGEAITNLLVGRIENAHGEVLAMLKGDAAARRAIEDALFNFGIPEEAIEAEAFMITIDEMESLSRLSAQAQFRLDLQLKQIERRRPIIANEIIALAQADIDTQAQDEDHKEYARGLSETDEDWEERYREAQEEERADVYRRAYENDEETR